MTSKKYHNPSHLRHRGNSRIGEKGAISRSTIRTLDGAYSLIMSRAQEKEIKREKLDAYSDLIPPEETVDRRIFLWSNKKKNYTLKEFQQIDNVLTANEIREVFRALQPYSVKVLTGRGCKSCNN